MRSQCENKSKETINSINICQNLGHSLGDRQRKILKDCGIMGRVVALINIHNEMVEKSRCVCFPFLREIHKQYSFNFGREGNYLTM